MITTTESTNDAVANDDRRVALTPDPELPGRTCNVVVIDVLETGGFDDGACLARFLV